jgi:hypothetical protein
VQHDPLLDIPHGSDLEDPKYDLTNLQRMFDNLSFLFYVLR